MKWFIIISITVIAFEQSFSLPRVYSHRIDFNEEAISENFNKYELEILKPLIDMLQLQYNTIAASIDLSRSLNDINSDQSLLNLNGLLLSIQPEFSFDNDFDFHYNNSLPTIEISNGFLTEAFSSDETNDIEDIIQENMDDAHQAIQNLIALSNDTEDLLARTTINKIKIVTFIYRMVRNIYALGIRAGRTAYCTYSSFPAINLTLSEGNREIGYCYNYTETSILRLRQDVNTAIKDIRVDVQDLIDTYKKIAKRHSLLGKLVTIVFNIRKISEDIQESSSKAIETIKEIKTDGPIIASKTKECATDSISNLVKNLNASLTDLNTCIIFVDDSTQGPELEPESFEESWENIL